MKVLTTRLQYSQLNSDEVSILEMDILPLMEKAIFSRLRVADLDEVKIEKISNLFNLSCSNIKDGIWLKNNSDFFKKAHELRVDKEGINRFLSKKNLRLFHIDNALMNEDYQLRDNEVAILPEFEIDFLEIAEVEVRVKGLFSGELLEKIENNIREIRKKNEEQREKLELKFEKKREEQKREKERVLKLEREDLIFQKQIDSQNKNIFISKLALAVSIVVGVVMPIIQNTYWKSDLTKFQPTDFHHVLLDQGNAIYCFAKGITPNEKKRVREALKDSIIIKDSCF